MTEHYAREDFQHLLELPESEDTPMTAEAATQYQPALPYPEREGGATSGWRGSDASRERAVSERDSGVVAKRQVEAMRLLDWAGGRGVTVAELRDATGLHHGQASAVLSNMHKAGRIARLTEKRGRCSIYVVPQRVDGREVAAPRRKAARCDMPSEVCEQINNWYVDTDEALQRVKQLLAAAEGNGAKMVPIVLVRRAMEGDRG